MAEPIFNNLSVFRGDNCLPTKQFFEQRADAIKRNRLLSFDQMMDIWQYHVRDWGDGEGEHSYVPHDHQARFHKSLARVRTHVTGNRGGKSISASAEAECYMTQPDTRIWILGETYDICDREWDYLQFGLLKSGIWYKVIQPEIERQMAQIGEDGSPKRYLRVHNSHPKRIEINWPNAPASFICQKQYGKLAGGGRSLEGEKLSGIIMAEGSRVPADIYNQNLDKRLSDKWGWVILPCTPKGKDDYLYVCYQNGMAEQMVVDIDRNKKKVYFDMRPTKKGEYHVDNTTSYWDSYETICYPAFYSPYYNKETYYSDVRRLFKGELDDKLFRERNFGTFESMAGSFFPGVNWDDVFVEEFPIPDDATHFRSIDPGRAGAAACTWSYIDKNGIFVVYDELYRSGLCTEEFGKLVLEQTKYPIAYTSGDREMTRHTHHSMRSPERQLKDLGIEPLFFPKKMPPYIIDRIDFWKNKLYTGKMKIFKKKAPMLCKEMEALEYAPKRYNAGHSITRDELAETPKHSLDTVTYLQWTYPRYKEPFVKPKKEVPESSVFDHESRGFDEGSFTEAFDQNKRLTNHPLI